VQTNGERLGQKLINHQVDTVLSDETVENQSVGLVDYCLDNPTANLFKAFEAQAE
jgi:hypothetical protein